MRNALQFLAGSDFDGAQGVVRATHGHLRAIGRDGDVDGEHVEGERHEDERPLTRQSLQGALEFRQVDFNYPGQQNAALKGINLDLVPGELTLMMGPSGSGKTTLLRCINLLELYDEGSIQVDGVEVGYQSYTQDKTWLQIDADLGIGTLTAPSGYTVNYTPANATVTAKALTLSAVGDSRAFNGGTASGGTVSSTGLVGGDSITGLSQSFASKNVLGASNSTLQVNGGYTISDGNGGNNYTVTTNTAPGTITPAALTVSTSSVNKVYDATTSAAGTAIVTGGTLYGGDSLSGGTFAFVSKNVGNNVTVNASGITVNDGNSGNNYSVTHAANNTSNITPAPLSVTGVTTANRVYDGTTVASLGGTATVTGLLSDVVSVTGTGAGSFADKHVGTSRAVTVSGFGLTGADAGNYSIVQPTGLTASITARPVSIKPNDLTRVYDGSVDGPVSATSADILAGDTVGFGITARFTGPWALRVRPSG